ncbi:hypothetical protein TNCV_4470311 [Trichonephila clavipes]|uniref:Uncharacterized protein n=1 Tax=Trichonephila clavipes TaxID=2585209 RepID=A0A8X6VFS5_TRICX|nr:hypothetical protein TNCV_4470311 [Trichonephila clavipes]
MTHPDIPIFYGYNAPSRRGNVSPFARVRPQRWGKKDAFHRIPFLVNRANVKTAIITLGTGDFPSLPFAKSNLRPQNLTSQGGSNVLRYATVNRRSDIGIYKHITLFSILNVSSVFYFKRSF